MPAAGARWLVWFLVAMLVAWAAPRAALAQASLDDYRVAITPSEDGESAHFELTLSYRDKKDDGFKYVGSRMIRNLKGHTPDGAPIRTFYAVEGSSGEVKLSFAVPQTADGRSTVVLEFDQNVDVTYGLHHRMLSVPWASVFKVPVRRMTVDVLGASAVAGDGYACEVGANGRHCVRSERETFEVAAPLDGGGETGWQILGGLALLGSVGVVAAMLLRHGKKLLETRGVYPPLAEPSYPSTAQMGYRAPPPLPTPEASTPVLSELDTRALRVKAAVAALTLVAVVAFAVTAKRSPIPLGAATAALQPIALAGIAYFIFRAKRSWVGLIPVVASAFLFSKLGPVGGGVGLGAASLVSLFASLDLNVSGGGSGSSSWSSSSSSCGGGGGGCGGGGGGGGCGG
jgi:hypothetical protein